MKLNPLFLSPAFLNNGQDFVMLNLLSVEETLRVSADLKMPSSTVAQEKQKIVGVINTIQERKN